MKREGHGEAELFMICDDQMEKLTGHFFLNVEDTIASVRESESAMRAVAVTGATPSKLDATVSWPPSLRVVS